MTNQQTLASRICQVTGILAGKLQADKTNHQQRYDYLSADLILQAVGNAIAEAGIAIVPSITAYDVDRIEYTKPDGKLGALYQAFVPMSYTITDGTETMTALYLGSGVDYSSPDKAVAKAMTQGDKYFKMKLFNIGIGNMDGEHENQPQQAPPQQKQARPQQAPPPPIDEPQASRFTRPMQPDALRQAMAKKVTGDNGKKASDKQQKYAASCLSAITTGEDERYLLTRALFGVSSTSELTTKQASAIIDWIDYKKEGDDWVFSEDARTEAARIIAEQRKAEGQAELFPTKGNGAYLE